MCIDFWEIVGISQRGETLSFHDEDWFRLVLKIEPERLEFARGRLGGVFVLGKTDSVLKNPTASLTAAAARASNSDVNTDSSTGSGR